MIGFTLMGVLCQILPLDLWWLLHVYLMIVEPKRRIPDFIKAGADIVSVHCEQTSTIQLHRTLNQIKNLGAKAGVVLNPSKWYRICA